jgi:hypothetical protein
MQKAQQGARPPRAKQAGGAPGQATQPAQTPQTPASQRGSPDWILEQQELRGNQTALGMIGGERDTAERAGGRPVGRMVEWTPWHDGTTKVNAVFPPGTRVTMDDVGTIADRWGLRVERWEEINGRLHIEFTTRAPADLLGWGAEIILGKPPPETELEQVQESESEGKGLLATASAGLAAALLAPAGLGLASPGPAQGAPKAAAPAAPGAGLTAGLLAAALGTAPTPAADKAPAAAKAPTAAPQTPIAAGKAPTVRQLLGEQPVAKAPTAKAPTAKGPAPSPEAAQKAAALEGKVKDAPAREPAKSPDEQLAPTVRAFRQAVGGRSPDLAQIQRLATASATPRLFELLGRGLTEGEVKNLVSAARRDRRHQGLLDLLEDQLYPQLSSGPQAAWDAALDEDLVEQAAADAGGKGAPEKKPAKPA